jgi:hypothetical protein
MLGSSSSMFDLQIPPIISSVNANKILELGCGQGKFGKLLKSASQEVELSAVQKVFSADDTNKLREIGYQNIFDRDVIDFFREGFDTTYDLIVALDVIEHFLYSDILSIIDFSLYRSRYMMLVWPSAHPQSAMTHAFDRHRSSFELRDLSNRFDVVHYSQTGFANLNCLHRYHLVLLRGHMNLEVLAPISSERL